MHVLLLLTPRFVYLGDAYIFQKSESILERVFFLFFLCEICKKERSVALSQRQLGQFFFVMFVCRWCCFCIFNYWAMYYFNIVGKLVSRKIQILALNVIRNQNKRREVFCHLKQQKASVFCLQETYSLPEDEKIWSAEGGGKIVFTHGTAHSRGLCILLNPNSTFEFGNIHSDEHGRFFISKLKVNEEICFIVNVYAPSDYRHQNEFIKNLSESILRKTDTTKLIIAGDWNCTLNSIDKRGGLPWKTTNYRDAVVGNKPDRYIYIYISQSAPKY